MAKPIPTKEVKELLEEDATNTVRRRSTRIAAVATRRASASTEDAPSKITKGRRTSTSQETDVVDDDDDDVILSSQAETPPKPKTSARSTKSPSRLNKGGDEVKGTPIRATRSRGIVIIFSLLKYLTNRLKKRLQKG
ncbi:hypothetical protein ILUMI_11776 [Ignelater luminosus]|uniref:Uncharacterized protein n=1 Tax=Ignelater luminosus TaxID=2038154 RepID=A0A8K0D1J1_IGNLU|nr:hypothetical protein ILUMI_11776 [Ignelater luminosus]